MSKLPDLRVRNGTRRGTVFTTAVHILILAASVLGLLYIIDTHGHYTRQTQARAISLAESAAAFLPPGLAGSLAAAPYDTETPAYRTVKNSLLRFASQNEEIDAAFLLSQIGGKLYYLADSRTPGPDAHSPPGRLFTGCAAADLAPDQKYFLTAPAAGGRDACVLIPIADPVSGDTLAIFGVAYPAAQWTHEVDKHVTHAVIVVLSVLALLLVIDWMLMKNKAFRDLNQKMLSSESLFRIVFEQAPMGIAIGRDYQLISNINPVFENILGRTKEDLTRVSWTEFTHPDDLEADLDNFQKLKQGQISDYTMIKRFVKPDGSTVWVNMIVVLLQLDSASPGTKNHLCMIEDISERVGAENALRESERSKAVLLSHLPGLAYRRKYDRDWTMLFVSDGCFTLTGYQPESLLYNNELSFNALIAPEYREILWQEWHRVLALNLPFRYEYEIVSRNHERKWVLELGQGIYDEAGEVEALEGIIVDISVQKKREAQILYMSDHDFMTGLYNHKYFAEMKSLLDEERILPLSVIIADINGVRLINDAFGHAAGDLMITKTAKVIQGCCGAKHILARTGGDEFSILLPGAGRDEARQVAETIKNACDNHNLAIADKAQHINLSIGFGTKKTKIESIHEAAKEAEEHMRKHKLLESKSYHSAILSSVMATMYARSHETEAHAERLAGLCKLIGEKLALPQKSLDELELLSKLHDIGKVGIDDRILNKPEKLRADEWTAMKKHSEIGSRIAGSTPELESVAAYILSHHERWDGKGYPRGLSGRDIPLLSRILAVADAYDAMTEDRIYRKALSRQEAVAEIRKNAGTQFDPDIADIFIEAIGPLSGA